MACKRAGFWSTWLSQSVEHVTLALGVVSSSPTLSVEVTQSLLALLSLDCWDLSSTREDQA